MSVAERVGKIKKRLPNKDLKRKPKQIHHPAKNKQIKIDHKQKIMARIEKAQDKIAELEQKLKKFELPPLPIPAPDPEPLTAEELHYLKQIGYKSKNYILLGRRGIFGGVIQNMHLHWKKHQTVRVCCDCFPKKEVEGMAEQLARLSKGIVVDIQEGHTVVLYRGRKYARPKNLIPKNTLTKRKALLKSTYEQAVNSHKRNIEELNKELKSYHEKNGQVATDALLPQENDIEKEHTSEISLAMDSELESLFDSDNLPAVSNADSVYESDSDFMSDLLASELVADSNPNNCNRD